MARLSLITRNHKQKRRTLILRWWNQLVTTLSLVVLSIYMMIKYVMDKPRIRCRSSQIDRYSILYKHVYESYHMAISQIRMNRACFIKLCETLNTFGGLKPNRNMDIDEQVAIFLHIIAHNVKNRVMRCRFHRSGDTISRCVTRVCNAVIRLHTRLLKKPEPIPENSTEQRWKWFKNCLGALDGTYIKCLVPIEEKPKYRTRKGDIATNVLGVCSPDMQFIFVLPGWEGSAADGRVLRDALDRPHGLKVSRPGYYLVDAGYTNGEGFLAPYRGQRYHLNDWRSGHQPKRIIQHETFVCKKCYRKMFWCIEEKMGNFERSLILSN
ncbi:putative harbinger transposase-derived nuclease domain-containing protein [Helianthus debilis subsp. tardiflorus]